jgi:hypothetical protein
MQLLTSLAHAATKRSPRNLAFSYKPKDRLLRMQPARYSSMHCLPAPQWLANYPPSLCAGESTAAARGSKERQAWYRWSG